MNRLDLRGDTERDIGHNDIDYEHKYDATNKTLSYTLNNPIQDRLIIDGL